MLNKIILASKSRVRKEILDKNKIPNEVKPSNVDEDPVKKGLIKEKAKPNKKEISKDQAEKILKDAHKHDHNHDHEHDHSENKKVKAKSTKEKKSPSKASKSKPAAKKVSKK